LAVQSATAQASKAVTQARGTLPFTGADTRGLLMLSGLAMVVGGLALLAADGPKLARRKA
jgi:hypothetical protein